MMKVMAAAIALATMFGLSPGAVYAQDEPDLDPIVAIVNGAEIHQSEVEAMFARLPQNMRNIPPQVLYPRVVDQLISIELIVAEADKQNLGESDQVLKEVERFRREAIQRAYLLGFVEEHVTEAAMKARYDEQIASMPQEEEVHARHILLETEEDAQAVIEALQGGGDFETLARDRSTGPSGPQGGDLGYFKKDAMVPEFAEAAFAIGVGEFSEAPVQTQFGWHVIKVEDRRATEPPTFEQSRAQIQGEMARDAITTHIAELQSSADIQRFGLDGEPIEEEPTEAN